MTSHSSGIEWWLVWFECSVVAVVVALTDVPISVVVVVACNWDCLLWMLLDEDERLLLDIVFGIIEFWMIEWFECDMWSFFCFSIYPLCVFEFALLQFLCCSSLRFGLVSSRFVVILRSIQYCRGIRNNIWWRCPTITANVDVLKSRRTMKSAVRRKKEKKMKRN